MSLRDFHHRGERSQRNENPDVKLSKMLSYILRHGAQKEGIPISQDGFVEVNDLLKHPKFQNITFSKIQELVKNNDKQRYLLTQIEKNGALTNVIRANQGHSLQVEVQMEEIQDSSLIPTVVHGTYLKNWLSIAQNGLKKMNRQHIHFAPGKLGENQVISGMRNTCDLYIFIDSEKAMKAGIQFLRSENNVILSSGIKGTIGPEFFLRVEDKNGNIVNYLGK
ncbi:tRNA 2'-phosphotransferase 1 [Nowakowskiella sp. JEL0078]|nr:tRNA 2'-phosphotransferase 1 [Nowakowskiella sp. JEL0078]